MNEAPSISAPPPSGDKVNPLVRAFAVGQNWKWTLVRVFGWIIVFVFISRNVLLPIRITGTSMAPNYVEGQIKFINALAYWGNKTPRRGDIVAVQMSGRSVMIMKRVIALPGEHLRFADRKVFINGKELPEEYVRYGYPREPWSHEETIPSHHYYVVGDNRSMPMKDHYQGKAPEHKIVGKVLF